MSGSPTPFARRSLGVLSRITPDRRRHKRPAVTLLGRFMRANRQEDPCRLMDASAGGAAILSPVGVAIAEGVVAYFDYLGGIEGPLVRGFDGGFALRIEATHHKRGQLAAQLAWLANRADTADAAERRHARTAPGNSLSQLALAEGGMLACKVSRRLDLGRLHRNPGPTGDRYRGDARQTPRARDAPSRAGLRRAIHRHSEPGRAAPIF